MASQYRANRHKRTIKAKTKTLSKGAKALEDVLEKEIAQDMIAPDSYPSYEMVGGAGNGFAMPAAVIRETKSKEKGRNR